MLLRDFKCNLEILSAISTQVTLEFGNTFKSAHGRWLSHHRLTHGNHDPSGRHIFRENMYADLEGKSCLNVRRCLENVSRHWRGEKRLKHSGRRNVVEEDREATECEPSGYPCSDTRGKLIAAGYDAG